MTGTVSGLTPPPSAFAYFVAELSPSGGQLLLSDTFGVSNTFLTAGIPTIAVDAQGGIYVAGIADGTVFLTTPGAYLSARPTASLDAFVFKLNPASNSLVYCTLFGGSDQDWTTGLAVDSAGDVYLTGYTISKDFPLTPGSFQSPGARVNIFIAKLDPTGSSVIFSSLFGGSFNDVPDAIAVDPSGNAYIDGWGYSGDLPVSPGAFDPAQSSGFAAKFRSNTGALVYLTYLGDGRAGLPGRLAAAPDGSVWIQGRAQAGSITTPDALLPIYPAGGPGDTSAYPYVKHLSADGPQQLYATYLKTFINFLAPGVVVLSDPANLFGIVDLTAPQTPHVSVVVNAASYYGQSIAPGEILTLFGPSIGPDEPKSYQIGSSGRVSTNLDGLQVLIGGIPAPILYASKNQINVVAPFSTPTQGQVTVQVTGAPVAVQPLTVNAVTASPGIFTLNGSGSGQGAIVNQDGTLNGPDNPAPAGSTVSIFVTGLGAMTPVPADGAIPVVPTSKPVLPIQVGLYSVAGQQPIEYVGDAPGQIEGLQQINIQVPPSVIGQLGVATVPIFAGENSNNIFNQVSLYTK